MQLPMNLEVSAMCGRVIVGDCVVMTHEESQAEERGSIVRIKAFSIEVEWEDGTFERLVDIPLCFKGCEPTPDEIEEQVEH